MSDITEIENSELVGGPAVRVGFFLHSPFPPSASVRVLPRREELLQGRDIRLENATVKGVAETVAVRAAGREPFAESSARTLNSLMVAD